MALLGCGLVVNGKAWSRVNSPSLGGPITGLAFSAANYGWAVVGSQTSTIILHVNGSKWS